MSKIYKIMSLGLLLSTINFALSRIISQEIINEYHKLSDDQKQKIKDYLSANYKYALGLQKKEQAKTGDEYWQATNELGGISEKMSENSPTAIYYKLVREGLHRLVNKINLAVNKAGDSVQSYKQVMDELESPE